MIYSSEITNKFGDKFKLALMQLAGLVDLPDVYGSALVYLSFEVLYTLFVELGLDKGLV